MFVYEAEIRATKKYFKVVFCRVRTESYPGYIYPGYYPTKNFCMLCRTFIPVPGTFVSSLRPFHKYPGYGYNVTAFLYSPGTSVSSVRPCHNNRKFCEFCNTFVPVPGTSVISIRFHTLPWTFVTSVRLWHNTRGTGISLLQYLGSPVFIQV